MNLTAIVKKPLLFAIVLALLAGCASKNQNGIRRAPSTVAIIGVTLAPGVESGKSMNAMSRELQELIHAKGGYQTMRPVDVGKAVNRVADGAYSSMLANFARNGNFHGGDIRVLGAARLPVRSAMILRVEENRVRPGAPKRVALRNNAGKVLTDRERIVLSTVREMQVKASLINLGSGATYWTRTYRSTPSTESSYVHYSGSSFSGSLAASFANTMTNGLKVPSGPAAPSNQLTLRSLMREIVRNMPGR